MTAKNGYRLINRIFQLMILLFGIALAFEHWLLSNTITLQGGAFPSSHNNDSNDPQLNLPNSRKQHWTKTIPALETSSACLLVCDDNHFLIEWLAYHYHVLNLRHLIITIDPNSLTTPFSVLQRWKDKMNIEFWNETRYLDYYEDDDYYTTDEQQAYRNQFKEDSDLMKHRMRQKFFNLKCLRYLKKQGRGWVLMADVDEFITINPELNETDFETVPEKQPNIIERGSVMTFLNSLAVPTKELNILGPCVPIYRAQFSSIESNREQVTKQIPTGFDGMDFLTMRWRKFGSREYKIETIIGEKCHQTKEAGPVKAVIDLSRLRLVDLYHDGNEGSPHQPLESICTYRPFLQQEEVGLVINHYSGTKEQFSYRTTDNRGLEYRLARFEMMNEYLQKYESDDLRGWLTGFVESVGKVEALRLLDGVGKLEPTRPNYSTATKTKTASGGEETYKIGDLVQLRRAGIDGPIWEWAHIGGVTSNGYYDPIYLDCNHFTLVGPERLRRSGKTDDGYVIESVLKEAEKNNYKFSRRLVDG